MEENQQQTQPTQDNKKRLTRNKKIILIVVAIVALAAIAGGIIALSIHISKKVDYDGGDTIEFEMREGCSDFYYSRLSENQQKMYRMLYREAENILYGGSNKNTLGVYKFATYGISSAEAETVWFAFRYDAPEFFIISNNYLLLSDSIEINISPEFKVAATRQSVLNSISATVEQVKSMLEGIDDEALKFKIIYDFIMESTDYKRDAQGKDIFDGYSYSIAGPLDGNNATQSICQGYACSVSYLCNLFDINCIYVGSPSLNHALNMVNIKDEWYYVDATYDDKDSSRYAYFLKKADPHWLRATSKSNNSASDNLLELLPEIKWGSNYDCKFQKDGIIYLMESRNKCSVVGCESEVTEAFIPQTVYDMQVRSIADRAFNACVNLKSAKIPETVTKIGEYAFAGCKSLESVQLNSGVKSISGYIFSGCSSLKGIEIPRALTYLSEGMFRGCANLTDIDIPESITSIGKYTFSGCSGLKKIKIPNTITFFGEGLFKDCVSLAGIDLPESVTSIGIQTFSGCVELTSIEIPTRVSIIGYRAFENCNKLTIYSQAFTKPDGWDNEWNCDNRVVVWNSANILSGVTQSGIRWILDADGLMSVAGYSGTQSAVEIPSEINSIPVTKIQGYAFSKRSDIISVEIPESIEFIGENAFNVSGKLVVYCLASEKPSGWDKDWDQGQSTVVWGAIAGAYGITDDAFQWRLTGDENIEITGYRGDSIKVKIPSTIEGKIVTSINKGAFSGLGGLFSVEIPSVVTQMPSNAFKGCGKLRVYCEAESKPVGWEYDWHSFAQVIVIWDCKNNDVAEDGNIYAEIDGINYVIKGDKAAISMSGAADVAEIVIPASIDYKGNSYNVEIGTDAFRDCVNLTSVTISSGITSIGIHAFEGCVKLQSVEIPSSVEIIDMYAFYNCACLEKIKIPFGVKSIGDSAFTYCSNLTDVEIPSSVVSIGSYAFSIGYRDDNNLREIWIPKSVEFMGKSVFSGRGWVNVYCEAEIKPTEWDEDWDVYRHIFNYIGDNVGTKYRVLVWWNKKQGETV